MIFSDLCDEMQDVQDEKGIQNIIPMISRWSIQGQVCHDTPIMLKRQRG